MWPRCRSAPLLISNLLVHAERHHRLGDRSGAATALALSRRGYELLINYSKSEREAKQSEAAWRDAGADTLLVRGNAALILSGGMLLLWQGHAERKARRSQVTPPQG